MCYLQSMAKMIQLRHVPDALHRKLKARASEEGLSLSEYLIREAERLVERPSPAQMRARLAGRLPVRPSMPPAQAVRVERETH